MLVGILVRLPYVWARHLPADLGIKNEYRLTVEVQCRIHVLVLVELQRPSCICVSSGDLARFEGSKCPHRKPPAGLELFFFHQCLSSK